MKIEQYRKNEREIVQDICIRTGSSDNLVNPEHAFFTLHMYCNPYLDQGTCFVIRNDEDVIKGYILGCEDFRKMDFDSYFAEIRNKAPHFVCRCDVSEYEKYYEEYPAHLHIDILEDYTGNGHGTALMKTLLEDFSSKGIRGIMVGVAKSNERAFAFYQKMGFRILEESTDGAILGMKLNGGENK